MKKILVTGGAGFLGSHLCQRLLDLGNEVVCMDNLITGDWGNIKDLRTNPHFEFIKHDITNRVDMDVDEIYNLACPASPMQYQKSPVDTMMTSVLGSFNLLSLATEKKARILQASTSEVYGNPIVHPQKEDYFGNVNPIGTRACYDEGKRSAETLFFDFHRQYQTDIRVVRLFNVYGPKMNPADGRVVVNFITQALRGKDLTIHGDGTQTRSFCYVDDMIDALIKVMTTDCIGPINLGNPEEITINQLAGLIIKLTGSSSKICYKPLPADDPIKRRPDITQAKELLDWKPSTSLEQGLLQTIEYFKKGK